ncbi:hypothetical protein BJ508DRAFT_310086 [Ascobolus immersus RN42]|uniref:Uncharacterized protein n=1 Tax=Ascobolus immersus RN42 TaxID=1160509 RepID=A0A3N4I063_ASCIM|nr:hypothetical protein BJ508DRAFT_310086 [Ascobolus immersus RN42]
MGTRLGGHPYAYCPTTGGSGMPHSSCGKVSPAPCSESSSETFLVTPEILPELERDSSFLGSERLPKIDCVEPEQINGRRASPRQLHILSQMSTSGSFKFACIWGRSYRGEAGASVVETRLINPVPLLRGILEPAFSSRLLFFLREAMPKFKFR